jgi:hypothetical protein
VIAEKSHLRRPDRWLLSLVRMSWSATISAVITL